MKSIILFFLPVFLHLAGCEKEDLTISECDQIAILSEEEFKNAPADHLTILASEIDEDCLWIKFGSSGCSGETWELKLVGSEKEYLSIPPQRDVRLSLKNEEMCEAYFVKEMTFDLKTLRSSGEKMILNLLNADTSLLYEF
ncbi:hypothetical protein KUV50_10340 [Membranicola marinus]|uniref:Uncharacterized protein n=1 Tax=Membranihabitans marinus TaxID=1227546 RepID=A0A953HZG4_9BACT|nr:hypothetical protein [Membranihabitans marinus]MBY5958532.1 hypothetical protein [Membranihabitans marinus]